MRSSKPVQAEVPSPRVVQKSDWGNLNLDSDWEWGDPDNGGDEGSVRWGPTPMVSPLCFICHGTIRVLHSTRTATYTDMSFAQMYRRHRKHL